MNVTLSKRLDDDDDNDSATLDITVPIELFLGNYILCVDGPEDIEIIKTNWVWDCMRLDVFGDAIAPNE